MNLTDAIARQAQERPHQVAVIEGDSILHYGAIDVAIWRAATWLRAQGVRAGDVVGVAMDNATPQIVAIAALARMGAVQLALPKSEPPSVRDALISRFAARFIVTDGVATTAAGRLLKPDFEQFLGAAAPLDRGARAAGGARTWALYVSSGTTGLPKATPTTHDMEAQRFAMEHEVFNFVQGERYLNFVNLSFSVSRYRALYCLMSGQTIVIPSERSDAAQICQAIDRYNITYLSGTPVHVHWLLPEMPADAPRFPGVRVMRIGATAVPQNLRQQIIARITPNLYVDCGANETGIFVVADPAMVARYPGTVGRPMPGVDLEIVGDDGRVVPAGEIGLLRVRSPGFGKGYVDSQQSVGAKGYIDGWFYPGDVGVISADGMVYLKGRADDMMSYDGMKIMPSDIEETLLQHSAVLEAAAFPVPHPRHQDVPAAAVTLKTPATLAELMEFCAGRLGGLAPRLLMVVRAMPKNSMGKIVKRELIDLALEQTRLGQSAADSDRD